MMDNCANLKNLCGLNKLLFGHSERVQAREESSVIYLVTGLFTYGSG